MKFLLVFFLIVSCGLQDKTHFNLTQQPEPEPSQEEFDKAVKLTLEFIREGLNLKEVQLRGLPIPQALNDFLMLRSSRYFGEVRALKCSFTDIKLLRKVIQDLLPEERNLLKVGILKYYFSTSENAPRLTAFYAFLDIIFAFYPSDEVFNILNNFKVTEGSVRYNGITGFVDFLDVGMEERTIELAFLMENYDRSEDVKKSFLEIFRSLPKSQQEYLSTDTNTEDPRSRIEPIDLIAAKHKIKIIRELGLESFESESNPYEINTLVVKSFLSVVLRHEFGVFISESDVKAYGLEIFKNKYSWLHTHLVFCYHHELDIIQSKKEKRRVKLYSYLIDSFVSTEYADFQDVRIECGRLKYEVKAEKKSGTKIPTPIPEIETGDSINAISTIGLVNEMSLKLRTLAFMYLNAKGYTLSQMNKVADLKSDFLAAAQTADVLIPVTHGLLVENFLLGTKEAFKVTATKTVLNEKTGTPTRIVFTSFFPPNSIDGADIRRETIYLDDVAKLISDRSKVKKNSLLVLNTSCFSEKTLDTWMYAWKLATKTNTGEKIIPPVVIGSKKGFDTDNAYSILTHLEYPLNTLEELARGGMAKDVINILKAPPQKTSALLNTVNNINIYYERLYGMKLFDVNFDKGFEPVINTEIAKYFDGSEEDIFILTNQNDPRDIKRF